MALSHSLPRRPAWVPAMAVLLGFQFLATPVCEGALYRWTADENSNLWNAQSSGGSSTSSNWTGSVIPGAGDGVVFTDSYLSHPIRTIHLNGNRAVDSAGFQDGDSFTLGTTVGGETLTIGQGTELFGYGIFSASSDSSSRSNVINCNVAMNDNSGDNTFGVYVATGTDVTIRGVVSGSNVLRKEHSGTLILTNANTYGGGTTITGFGTLRVSNTSGSATGTGSVTVNSPATLAGGGRVGGAITVDAGGFIAPGTSIGTLTALSGVTLNGTYACELDGASADQLAVTGTLDVRNGTLDLRELGLPTGTSFTIASATQVQGPFASVTGLRAGFWITYNSDSIVIERTTVLHVDGDAAPGGTGADWGNALDSLDLALSDAVPGDEIWVKEGIYVPGHLPISPDSTFDVRDGVSLLGGFAGTETSASQRDPRANLTVLSGDLQNNDTGKVNGITTTPANIAGTNAYNVVTVSFAAPVIDGFTITGGSALVAPIVGQGLDSRGGGIIVDTDFARIPTLSNCRIIGNTAVQGGGIFVHSNGGCDIESCDFRANSSTGRGGAAYYWWSRVTTKNCNFSGNRAGDDGGAIYDDPQANGTSLFVNCTITGNTAVDGGGGLNANTTGSASAQVFNTLIWNNSSQGSTAGTGSSVNNTSMYAFSHCLFQNINLAGTNNLDGAVAGNDPAFFYPLDPALAPSIEGEFRPGYDTAVLDAGTNSAIAGISEDLSGETRILGGTVDIGAYEGPLHTLFDFWMSGFFPGETDPAIIGPGADPSGNGLNNALSFVTNTSPLSTEPAQPVAIETVEPSGECRFLVPEVNQGWEQFGTYLEYSFDLDFWWRMHLSSADGSGEPTPGHPGILFYRVEGTYPDSDLERVFLDVDKASHPKIFVRVGVFLP